MPRHSGWKRLFGTLQSTTTATPPVVARGGYAGIVHTHGNHIMAVSAVAGSSTATCSWQMYGLHSSGMTGEEGEVLIRSDAMFNTVYQPTFSTGPHRGVKDSRLIDLDEFLASGGTAPVLTSGPGFDLDSLYSMTVAVTQSQSGTAFGFHIGWAMAFHAFAFVLTAVSGSVDLIYNLTDWD